MNNESKIKEIIDLENEKIMLILSLNFGNISSKQTNSPKDIERINNLLDRFNEIREHLKKLNNDN